MKWGNNNRKTRTTEKANGEKETGIGCRATLVEKNNDRKSEYGGG
jgi:hypothetical protein